MKNLINTGKPQGLSVRFKTEICNAAGIPISAPRYFRNMVTDWGMDQLPATTIPDLINFLVIGDEAESLKRAAAGQLLTIDYSGGAGNLLISTDINFFETLAAVPPGDLGRTLKIAGFPELLITAVVDAKNIQAKARGSVWPEGFDPAVPGTGTHSDFAVHLTNSNSIAGYLTRFSTLDTSAADRKVELNDSSNSRTIHQRIFLSSIVSGTAWTARQLGWSDGNGSNNCFGKSTLPSPDVIPVGNRYRVTLQVFSAQTPIDISGLAVDWGAAAGSHVVDVRQERIGLDTKNGGSSGVNIPFNFRRQKPPSSLTVGYHTNPFTLGVIAWEGDAGFTDLDSRGFVQVSGSEVLVDDGYIAGDHRMIRRCRWSDTLEITNATGLYVGHRSSINSTLLSYVTIRPQSGTISKPLGHWMELNFPLVWTRELVN